MKTYIAILLSTLLAGCAGSIIDGVLNDYRETLGVYTAPTLAGSPRSSNCGDERCRALDAIEEKGYELARQKKITWVKLVDTFYKKRAEYYPSSQDSSGVNELKSYQRALAEQMDLGKLTESQWAYLVEKKTGDISARNEALSNSAPRQRNCTTTNVGTKSFPEYKTTCN
jgi:hypothetical protein